MQKDDINGLTLCVPKRRQLKEPSQSKMIESFTMITSSSSGITKKLPIDNEKMGKFIKWRFHILPVFFIDEDLFFFIVSALVSRKPTTKKAVNLQKGDITLCKMRGFCEWPCFVTGTDGKFIHVEFFGDRTTYKAKIDSFLDIKESLEIVRYNLQRLKSLQYRKAVRELENMLKIPASASMLKQ